MKKLLKFILWILGILVVGIVILLVYVKTMLPNVGEPEEMTIKLSPDRIERGEYLANHVMACMDCHSTRDFSLFAGPVVPGTLGQGGEIFDQNMGFPGRFISPNITPAKLSNWTDGEIFRAITSGVSKDGRALFPVMPHPNYGQIDPEDIKSIIAYLRSLPPIENEVEKSKPDFPMNFILNTIPKKATFQKTPPKSNKIEYGKYLATAASCADCHTKQEKGKIVGEPFAGGMEFQFPDGSILRAKNITPHPDTGIGYWTEEMFIEKFKTYGDSTYNPHKVGPGDFQTMMPWMLYGKMKTEDLKAIFAYLKSVKPVENDVEFFSPAQ
ncbi:c-type cytochrome [Sunxiuqinia sp. A32]|uniref:c-type cytochrome n=1 Tax=Sunxiuqinia sp. A32 TaxID=3461496 RepID=UPI004045FCB7